MNTKVQNSEVKNHIEIEGVMLSPEAIRELKSLQERDNEGIEWFSRTLSDALCLIVELQCDHGSQRFNEQYPEATEIMNGLSLVRKEILKLKAR